MDQLDNLNHKFTKIEAEDKTEATMTDAIMISKVIIKKYRDLTVETGDRTEVVLGRNKIIGEEIIEVMQGILTDKTAEESIEIITEMKVMTEAETGLEKGHFPEMLVVIEIGVQAIVDPGQD